MLSRNLHAEGPYLPDALSCLKVKISACKQMCHIFDNKCSILEVFKVSLAVGDSNETKALAIINKIYKKNLTGAY